MTGIGECLLRTLTAKRITDAVTTKNDVEASACIKDALNYMTEVVGGDGGGIVVTCDGLVGVNWNSTRMAWAYAKGRAVGPRSYCFQNLQLTSFLSL